jgi:hypothetical protein
MANPRYPYWIEEQSSTYRGPTMSRVLFGLALVALALIAAFAAGPTATAEGGDREQSFCELHRGQEAWDRICAETRRRQ